MTWAILVFSGLMLAWIIAGTSTEVCGEYAASKRESAKRSCTEGGKPAAASQQCASAFAEQPLRQCFSGSARSRCQSSAPRDGIRILDTFTSFSALRRKLSVRPEREPLRFDLLGDLLPQLTHLSEA